MEAEPDNDNPLDPEHLSPLHRAKLILLAIVAAPFILVWMVASWVSEKISRGLADLGPDAPDN